MLLAADKQTLLSWVLSAACVWERLCERQYQVLRHVASKFVEEPSSERASPLKRTSCTALVDTGAMTRGNQVRERAHCGACGALCSDPARSPA
jgi:hypothetical protein